MEGEYVTGLGVSPRGTDSYRLLAAPEVDGRDEAEILPPKLETLYDEEYSGAGAAGDFERDADTGRPIVEDNAPVPRDDCREICGDEVVEDRGTLELRLDEASSWDSVAVWLIPREAKVLVILSN